MRKISIILLTLVMGFSVAVKAQAPYKHSVGGTLGTLEAVSYKTFFTDHLALDVNACYKITVGPAAYHINGITGSYNSTIFPRTIEVNPNLEYESATNKGGLLWFIGGGLSLGYCHNVGIRDNGLSRGWGYAQPNWGKFGVNAIGGIEYKFNFPMTLQVDFRPGYGLLFDSNNETFSYFDWGLCVGVRYCLH
ncbi:MAG: hypothetical protein MJZ46_05670 [Bacteroidales bacterium]|nr:hypothetical protein [Bacteroidales bacterium]